MEHVGNSFALNRIIAGLTLLLSNVLIALFSCGAVEDVVSKYFAT